MAVAGIKNIKDFSTDILRRRDVSFNSGLNFNRRNGKKDGFFKIKDVQKQFQNNNWIFGESRTFFSNLLLANSPVYNSTQKEKCASVVKLTEKTFTIIYASTDTQIDYATFEFIKNTNFTNNLVDTSGAIVSVESGTITSLTESAARIAEISAKYDEDSGRIFLAYTYGYGVGGGIVNSPSVMKSYSKCDIAIGVLDTQDFTVSSWHLQNLYDELATSQSYDTTPRIQATVITTYYDNPVTTFSGTRNTPLDTEIITGDFPTSPQTTIATTINTLYNTTISTSPETFYATSNNTSISTSVGGTTSITTSTSRSTSISTTAPSFATSRRTDRKTYPNTTRNTTYGVVGSKRKNIRETTIQTTKQTNYQTSPTTGGGTYNTGGTTSVSTSSSQNTTFFYNTSVSTSPSTGYITTRDTTSQTPIETYPQTTISTSTFTENPTIISTIYNTSNNTIVSDFFTNTTINTTIIDPAIVDAPPSQTYSPCEVVKIGVDKYILSAIGYIRVVEIASDTTFNLGTTINNAIFSPGSATNLLKSAWDSVNNEYVEIVWSISQGTAKIVRYSVSGSTVTLGDISNLAANYMSDHIGNIINIGSRKYVWNDYNLLYEVTHNGTTFNVSSTPLNLGTIGTANYNTVLAKDDNIDGYVIAYFSNESTPSYNRISSFSTKQTISGGQESSGLDLLATNISDGVSINYVDILFMDTNIAVLLYEHSSSVYANLVQFKSYT